MFRKEKALPDPNDPRYGYMVGMLVGAAEMMSSYMHLHGDERAQGMASRVDRVIGFFETGDTLAEAKALTDRLYVESGSHPPAQARKSP